MRNTRKSIFKVVFFVGVATLTFSFVPSFEEQQSVSDIHNTCIDDSLYYPKIDSGEYVIHHQYYDLVYDELHEQAKWVFYKLYPSYLNGPYKRRNDFRADPKVISNSANHSDYRGSGYDRGHLMPAADMTWSEVALSESFYYSNMSPQHPSFNRGVWKRLESKVRSWCMESDSLFIITGPVVNTIFDVIGQNRVAVPGAYFKVIMRFKQNKKEVIAFLLPNTSSKESLESFVYSIDSLKQVIDIDFFHYQNEEFQRKLESSTTKEMWDW
jgi:endonuclease G